MYRLTFYLFFLFLCSCKPASLSGSVKVIDGDSLLLNESIEIRLWGIDALEYNQQCLSSSQKINCGKKAKEFLETVLDHKRISCIQKDIDHYNRIIAICYTDDNIEINKLLVAEGWAIDYTRYSGGRYRMIEYKAKRQNKGLWQYKFDLPYIWRQNNQDKL